MKIVSKRGFTLSELLVVIVIIGVIAVIAIPSIILINKNIDKRLYSTKVDMIVSAAEIYASDNPDIFNGKSEVPVYVAQLIQADLLKVESNDEDDECSNVTVVRYGISITYPTAGCILNPKTGESMNSMYVMLTKDTNGVHVSFCETDNCDPTTNDDNVAKQLNVLVCEKIHKEAFDAVYTKTDGSKGYCDCKIIGNDSTNVTVEIFDETTNVAVDACLISGNATNNWLYYSPNGDTNYESSNYWRVMGLYNVNGEVVAKMITDEPID